MSWVLGGGGSCRLGEWQAQVRAAAVVPRRHRGLWHCLHCLGRTSHSHRKRERGSFPSIHCLFVSKTWFFFLGLFVWTWDKTETMHYSRSLFLGKEKKNRRWLCLDRTQEGRTDDVFEHRKGFQFDCISQTQKFNSPRITLRAQITADGACFRASPLDALLMFANSPPWNRGQLGLFNVGSGSPDKVAAGLLKGHKQTPEPQDLTVYSSCLVVQSE